MIDLATIDKRLDKARQDVAFWENARALFLDPRMSEIVEDHAPALKALSEQGIRTARHFRPYGELKQRVLKVLPPFGSNPMTSTEIADAMVRDGYQFAAKTPSIAVNDALVSLDEEVYQAGNRGLSKLWTRAAVRQGKMSDEEREYREEQAQMAYDDRLSP